MQFAFNHILPYRYKRAAIIVVINNTAFQCILIFGCALLLSLKAYAEDTLKDLPPKPHFIDLNRDYLSDKFLALASEIDSFFGNERNFTETNKSVLQLNAAQLMGRNGSPVIALSYKAKFILPNAQKRFHLLLESNPDQNLPGTTLAQQQQPKEVSLFKEFSTPDSYGAALRFENKDNSHWRFSADWGIKADGGSGIVDISIHPFARSSVSFITPLNLVQLKLTESLYTFNTTGPGENTLLELDRRISDKILLRSTSGATFLYDKEYFDIHQDVSIFHTLNQDVSLLYQISANGVSRPSAEVSEYVALLVYRQRMHQEWIFLELNPQLHYPKNTNFLLDAQFIVRLEFMLSQ
jgi:hypothetical protein